MEFFEPSPHSGQESWFKMTEVLFSSWSIITTWGLRVHLCIKLYLFYCLLFYILGLVLYNFHLCPLYQLCGGGSSCKVSTLASLCCHPRWGRGIWVGNSRAKTDACDWLKSASNFEFWRQLENWTSSPVAPDKENFSWVLVNGWMAETWFGRKSTWVACRWLWDWY